MERERVLQLVRQNDDAARRALFEEFFRRTYAVVYGILRNRESAEDITQDAFIKAFQNLDRLREQEKFGAWLAVIASNLARNHLKREKRLLFTDDMSQFETGSSGGTEAEALRRVEVQQIRKAIRTLPPDQYQVIILQYYYDLKIDDIAALLKVNPGTVKSRLFRAREKLSKLLELSLAEHGLSYEGGERGNA